MGENTYQIEREIEATRSDLGRNLEELEGKAREIADWRTHYRNHSGVFLGLAFGTGLVLGLGAIPRGSQASSGPYDYAMGHDPTEPKHAAWSGNAARAKRQFGQTWEQIADALLRLASAKAIQVVGEFVPGFRDQLRPEADRPVYPRTSAR